MLNFSQMLDCLKSGVKMRRAGWSGKGMWIYKVWGCSATVDQKCETLESFIIMKTADDKYVPWLASQTDLLAEDWETA